MKVYAYFMVIAAFTSLEAFSQLTEVEVNNRQSNAITSMISRAILDPNTIFVLGETRFDARRRYVEGENSETMIAVASTLRLTVVAPITVLRGIEIKSRFIWVQAERNKVSLREEHFSHIPDLSKEGVWMLLLKPVVKLPNILSPGASDLRKSIVAAAQEATSPYKFAKDLKVNPWLNEHTWFELASSFSAFRISGKSVRDLPIPNELSSIASKQFSEHIERMRQLQKSIPPRTREYFLSEAQLSEIDKLVTLFKNPNQPPSISQLLELKSEFSDAVLRELAKTPTADLEDGLRQLKEAIPQKTLEDIFSQK